MRVLLRYLKPYTWQIVLILILATVSQVASLFEPIPFQWIMDRYLLKIGQLPQDEILTGILWLLGLSVGIAMIARIAATLQEYWVALISDKVSNQIYNDGIQKALQMPFEVYEDEQSGKTLSIIQKVWTDTKTMITQFVSFIFPTIISTIFIFIFSIRVHWAIGPMYLGAMIVIAVLSMVLGRRIKTIQKDIVTQSSELAGSTTEVLRNIEMVKGLGLIEQEFKRLKQNTQKILNLEILKLRKTRGLSFTQGTLIQLTRTVLTGFLVYLTLKQQITIGEFITFRTFTFYLFFPLGQLGTIINTYRDTQVSLENFDKLMRRPIEKNNSTAEHIGPIHKLEFNQVGFSRDSGKNFAVKDIDFSVKSGETIAFVGPSGAGKTTLVKLLIGFYEPTSGQIKYNGKNRSDINIEDIRSQLGLVSQDNYMFAGSIRDNLKFVKPNATDKEMLEVMKQAQCQSILERADKGLDTQIGENGLKISGGEKQRLSIARALLRNPNVLIFDEATSALDSMTEKEISTTIKQISKAQHRITISIAHRLSTVMHADRIYVLERGDVSEVGSHTELLKKKGLYYALWREQIGQD